MARDVQAFSVTIPPGGVPAAPQRFPLTMPARIVAHVTVIVPPGPRGELGFALGAAGVAVLPSNAGGYIVADYQSIDWDVEGQIESGAWQLLAYNAGLYSHTLQIVFQCELPPEGVPEPVSLTTIVADLASLIGSEVQ